MASLQLSRGAGFVYALQPLFQLFLLLAGVSLQLNTTFLQLLL
ncbi:hypothetical protein [Synechococcus sp. CBW1108]|nr:hypothetical protein [Synechococcus sp. CBW1108]